MDNFRILLTKCLAIFVFKQQIHRSNRKKTLEKETYHVAVGEFNFHIVIIRYSFYSPSLAGEGQVLLEYTQECLGINIVCFWAKTSDVPLNQSGVLAVFILTDGVVVEGEENLLVDWCLIIPAQRLSEKKIC